MERKVLYTPTALADIEDIAAWSWQQHPETSDRFLTGLINHIELLAQFPLVGAIVKDQPGVRQILHTPFRVYYRCDPKTRLIEILHIWHGSRQMLG